MFIRNGMLYIVGLAFLVLLCNTSLGECTMSKSLCSPNILVLQSNWL